MGQLLGSAVLAVIMIAGPAGAQGWSRPTDDRGVVSEAAAPEPTRTASTPARTSAAICQDTAKIVMLGLQMFVGQMERVSAQAGAGDLIGADLAVRDAGQGLSFVAAQLRRDAVAAEDASLRATIDAMADEFDRLGRSLSGVAALGAFDAAALDAMAGKMSTLCGPIEGGSGGTPTASMTSTRPEPRPSPAGG
jgi:hypothetical protein